MGVLDFRENYHLDWPQQFDKIVKSNSSRISKRQVMINSNLFSLYKGENYSLRRKTVNEIDSVDLFGYGWCNSFINKLKIITIDLVKYFRIPRPLSLNCAKYFFSNPRNYFGPVVNKSDIVSKYQIAVIIENCNDYMSEKVFDSFFSGTIPVYVGPNLVDYGIPSYLYFQAENSVNGIKMALAKAMKQDYLEWKSNLDHWLNDPGTAEKWSDTNFIRNLENNLTNLITSNSRLQR